MRQIITLLTDFGTADGYVGEVKGVLASLAPDAQVIDIAHDVERHDTTGARLALARYWRRFPPGTVHLVVVDPGVGSERAAIAVRSGAHFLVGPDSGVLSPALLGGTAHTVRLRIAPTASNTFHGRDVFAPAAAALVAGASLEDIGEVFGTPRVVRTPEPHRLPDGSVDGEIIHVDRFGNAVSNVIWRPPSGTVWVKGTHLPLLQTYSDVPVGEALALIGSNGLLEIAVREGSAAAKLGLSRGDRLRVETDPGMSATSAPTRRPA